MGSGNKSILKMELEALPSLDLAKTKDKLTQGTHLRESLKNGKRKGECYKAPKSKENHRKSSTERSSIAIEVLLHPCRQKRLVLLRKGINLEERNASIASAHLIHLIHHHHFIARNLQRQEV